MITKLTPTEARQGTGPRAMFWVLTGSRFRGAAPLDRKAAKTNLLVKGSL